jgi:hypothetical protein
MREFVGPPPPGHVVNHLDGIKVNNRIDNLEYCTPKENSEHAAALGLMPSIYTEEQIIQVHVLAHKGLSPREIAKRTGVHRGNQYAILKGLVWTRIRKAYERAVAKIEQR